MYCINVLYKCTVLVYYIQGGQNFFEKIRTKIRTFLEEIRTFFMKENKRTRELENKRTEN